MIAPFCHTISAKQWKKGKSLKIVQKSSSRALQKMAEGLVLQALSVISDIRCLDNIA